MRTVLILSALLFALNSYAQRINSIDSLIAQKMSEDRHASLAVGIVQSGEIVHLSTHGYQDMEIEIEATTSTSFQIASMSKIVTSLAIFKLIDEQKIELEEDVNKYLPFQIVNPKSPSSIIRIADLLNHRSCIVDDVKFYQPYWHAGKGDSNIKLKDFLSDYLVEDGEFYNIDHFIDCTGGGPFKYSNTGYALLGLIVETVSGSTYEEFCQENIFEPLGMNNSSWFLAHLDQKNIAKPYFFTDSTELEFKGHNGYPDYPAGQLRTSIEDFSALIQGYLNAKGNSFIISEKMRDKLAPLPQYAQVGFYTWFLNPMNNNLYYQHGGRDQGVRARAMIDRNFNHAIIVFSNSNENIGPLIRNIEKLMFSR